MTTTLTQKRPLAVGSLLWAGGSAALIAVIGNLLLYALARGPLGLALAIPAPPTNEMAPLAIGAVVMASLAGALGGTLLLRLLQRLIPKHALTLFQGIAWAFLLLSLGGPLTLAGVEQGTIVVLTLMHFIAGVPVILLLRRAAQTEA